MAAAECAALTLAMRDTGRAFDWRGKGLKGPVLDKHSTGGVGDLVSLVPGPMLAACGAHAPLIAGAGLDHTGGTTDKLEAIPGYRIRPDRELFKRTVREAGVTIVAATDSSVNRLRFRDYDFGATASWGLLSRVAAARGAAEMHIGRVFSSDFFYHPDTGLLALLKRFGFLALDMETAGLYGVAAEQVAEALSVLIVSDRLDGGHHMTAEQRETGVDAMVRLVLDSLLP